MPRNCRRRSRRSRHLVLSKKNGAALKSKVIWKCGGNVWEMLGIICWPLKSKVIWNMGNVWRMLGIICCQMVQLKDRGYMGISQVGRGTICLKPWGGMWPHVDPWKSSMGITCSCPTIAGNPDATHCLVINPCLNNGTTRWGPQTIRCVNPMNSSYSRCDNYLLTMNPSSWNYPT